MSKPEIIICPDVDELNRRAAARLSDIAADAISRAGRFAVALSGGSTPKALYALLASPAYRDRLDWSRVHVFFGDERCVPPDHAESNYRMVEEALLSKIQITVRNIHRMDGEKEPGQAAEEYEHELREFFALGPGQWPRFDLILLGLGEDGHTASLFPGSPVLDEQKRLVAAAYVEKLEAHRLTLTLPVINNAGEIIFLIAGAGKRPMVERLLGGSEADGELPAARVRPVGGRLTWLISRDAAGGIK